LLIYFNRFDKKLEMRGNCYCVIMLLLLLFYSKKHITNEQERGLINGLRSNLHGIIVYTQKAYFITSVQLPSLILCSQFYDGVTGSFNRGTERAQILQHHFEFIGG
jgi:hypothetical protein